MKKLIAKGSVIRNGMEIRNVACSLLTMAASISTSLAAEPTFESSTLDGAVVAFREEGATRAFAEGARIFSNRPYTVIECPPSLKGLLFFEKAIETTNLRIEAAGRIIVLTPQNIQGSGSQTEDLEAQGFKRSDAPLFQLAQGDLHKVWTYFKEVKEGERYRFGKWVVVMGYKEARPWPDQDWSKNTGELLYNGIRLPAEWPPNAEDPADQNPKIPPYLMHRPDVAPVDIGRQLFVDDFLIESTNLERIFHLPQKYEGNPVLRPETELEINKVRFAPARQGEPGASAAVPKSGGVWWIPEAGHFKMWYEAGWLNTIAMATSKDGIHWERPVFDIRPGTNQVLPQDLTADSWTVVPNWDSSNPEEKYTLFVCAPGADQPGTSLTSPDGIHWTKRVETGVTGDRSGHFYNPFRKKWIYSLRTMFPGRGRARHYHECDDFLKEAKWAPADKRLWLMTDDRDPVDYLTGQKPQLYNFDAVAYESLMLGMFEIHQGPSNGVCEAAGLPKITELQFAYSRDGFHWDRPDRRIAIPAERKDVWDRGYVQSIGNVCVIKGDKLWFYYSAFQGDASKAGRDPFLDNGMYSRGSTGGAWLRRDGFASLRAAAGSTGTVTTRPLRFSGQALFVNADVPKGTLRAEIRDLDDRPIPPFTLDNSIPFTGDSTLTELRWKGVETLSSLAGRPVRLHFEVTNGDLYAFWISQDASGRSDGYVAGGGPGYTGPVDTVGKAALAPLPGTDLSNLAPPATAPLSTGAEAPDRAFLEPPRYIGPPTAEHVPTNRAFQGIPSLAVSPGGRLWATWYASVTPEEDHNNYVVLATSGDDGKTWQEILVVDPDGPGPVRAFDPELWLGPDGKLRLFWAQAILHDGTISGTWTLETDAPESAQAAFGPPTRLTDGIMMCKPLALSNGEWALPVSTWRKTDQSAKMVVSADQGRTWSVRGGCQVPEKVRNYDEHMFVERRDGSLWMLARTTYGIGESVSTDRGATWPELTPSAIPHPSSRFFISRLKSGNLLLVKHGPMDQQTKRERLTAFVSTDDGRSWGGGLLLDERDGISYPDGQQAGDGTIYITYDINRRGHGKHRIHFAAFREEDAAAGRIVTDAVRLRQLVSEASGGQEPAKSEP